MRKKESNTEEGKGKRAEGGAGRSGSPNTNVGATRPPRLKPGFLIRPLKRLLLTSPASCLAAFSSSRLYLHLSRSICSKYNASLPWTAIYPDFESYGEYRIRCSFSASPLTHFCRNTLLRTSRQLLALINAEICTLSLQQRMY